MSTTGHHSSRSIVFAVCQKMDNVLARVLVILLALCLGVTKLRGCEVFVEQPWEEYTYIPEGSVVEVSCSGGTGQSPQWSIKLPGVGAPSQFSFQASITLLNNRGFYQKESELDNSSVLLHINNTEDINGTGIGCDDISTATTISRTVLIVYESTAMEVQVHDSQLEMVIISWTPLQYHWDGNYTLTVTSSNTDTQFYQLQEVSTFTFTAPKDAPPCEVYNFSVTATYVGATYTGAGCSVPSPVLSTMLPSLPDIKKIESSLSYAVALEKHNLEMITMTVSLMPSAHYCEDYPVQNFTLVAENPLSLQESFLLPNENSSIALPKNNFYRFKVVAKNVIGKVSTEYREIFTSDVQTVGAVESTEDKQFRVNCTFMTGSNALGCMVVLVSVYNNATVKLTRQNSSNNVEKSVIVTYPPSCYTKVFGYDIENNGDIGNLAVPGELNKIASNSNSIAECSPEVATAGVPRLLLIITGLGVLIALLIIVIILVLCVCVCRMKKSHRFKTDDLKRSSHPKLSSVSIQPVLSPEKCSKYSETPLPIYDLPTTLARNRMSSEMTESTDYSRTRHFSNKTSHSEVEDIDCQDYAQLQENFYHVLECGGTRYSPELSPADLNNFYDNPEVFTTLKSESTPDSTTEEIPVYQEITAYQQQRQGKSSKT